MVRAIPLLFCLLLAGPASALLVEYRYEFRVTSIDAEEGSLAGYLEIGDLVTGTFRFDTDTSPASTDGATHATYEFFGGAIATIGDTTFLPVFGEPLPGLPTFDVFVWDGVTLVLPPHLCPCPPTVPTDRFSVGINRDLAAADGTRIDLGFGFREEGADATFIEDLALPASLPTPTPGTVLSASAFLSRPGTIEEHHYQQVGFGLVSLVSVVPEPALGLLVGAVALALLTRCRS